MIRKLLTLCFLIFILMPLMHITSTSDVKAQNYSSEYNPMQPGTWGYCSICGCIFDWNGNCCCGGAGVCACQYCLATIYCNGTCYCQSTYSQTTCWCPYCSSFYDCNTYHNCLSGSCYCVIHSTYYNCAIGCYECSINSSNNCYCPIHSIYHNCVSGCPACSNQGGGSGNTPPSSPESQAAIRIIANARITPAPGHTDPLGNGDNANASQNLIDAAAGLQASTSSYGNAPNPSQLVWISSALLTGVETLAVSYPFSISEIVGGSHSVTSSHYNGNSIDVNYVNGVHVGTNTMSNTEIIAFREAAQAAGATRVLDPLNEPVHHFNHFHVEW